MNEKIIKKIENILLKENISLIESDELLKNVDKNDITAEEYKEELKWKFNFINKNLLDKKLFFRVEVEKYLEQISNNEGIPNNSIVNIETIIPKKILCIYLLNDLNIIKTLRNTIQNITGLQKFINDIIFCHSDNQTQESLTIKALKNIYKSNFKDYYFIAENLNWLTILSYINNNYTDILKYDYIFCIDSQLTIYNSLDLYFLKLFHHSYKYYNLFDKSNYNDNTFFCIETTNLSIWLKNKGKIDKTSYYLKVSNLINGNQNIFGEIINGKYVPKNIFGFLYKNNILPIQPINRLDYL